MTKEQIDNNIQTIKNIIQDKGFIFTNSLMRGPVDLGNLSKNELVDILGPEAYDNNDPKIALEASTFWLNYDYDNKELIENITSPIFQNGPNTKYKRFSLYTLNYQINPTTYEEQLIGFRGSVW